MKQHLLWALCLCLGSTLYAQETQKPESLDTVLIDTKTPIARKNSGKVIATITAETLQRSAGRSVASLINEVSGIEINGSRSNEGQNLGYFVRGGRNRQVVIMVDGVQLNDASQIANDYDLRIIPAQTVASIEIIKGASSVLYGSGAATAVISITTKKASAKPIAATFTSVYGTNRAAEDERDYSIDEFTNYVGLSGTLHKFFYTATFSNRYVDGLSAVAALPDAPLNESDVFDRFDGRINLGYTFNENVKMSQFFSFDTFNAGFDDFSFSDANNLSETKQLKTGGHFEWKYSKGIYVFNDSFTWIEREIESSFPAKYDSKAYSLDNYITYEFSEKITALLGLNVNVSSFNSFTIPFGGTNFAQDVSDETAKFDIIDPYLNFVYISDFGLNINAGARLNNHSNYGSHVVYNLNPSYTIDLGANDLKLLGSYSTAYITPSLFQLYDPLYGNEALEPEENRTIEGGFEFTTENDLRVSAVYFNRNEENYIDFVTVDPVLFISQYQNIAETFDASGVEVEISKRFGKKLNVAANYTNTQADERFALRIPEHKGTLMLSYYLAENSSVGLKYQYNSERTDSFFSSETFMSENVMLTSYGLLDFNVSTKLTKVITVFGAVSNILNEEYEELYRFQTKGRNVRAGVTLAF